MRLAVPEHCLSVQLALISHVLKRVKSHLHLTTFILIVYAQVRLQACNNRKSFSGQIPAGAVLGAAGAAGPTPVAAVPSYASATDAYRRILADEGVMAGLYRGYCTA